MISIFIPVHNEGLIIEENTNKIIKFLNSKDINYEILFGENGSVDNTLKLVKKLNKKDPDKIKYITCNKRGIGRVFRRLITEYNFNYLVTVDMDLSHDLNFIIEATELLKKGYDIVIGFKKGVNQKRLWYRKLFTNVNILMCRYLLGLPYKDFGAGAKSYSSEFLKGKENYIDNLSFFTTKLFFYGKKEKAKISQVPVYCSDTRKSKLNVVTLPLYITYHIIKFALIRK